MKREVIDGVVYPVLRANQDIPKGTELRYDYGDDQDEMPWRAKEDSLKPRYQVDGDVVPPTPGGKDSILNLERANNESPGNVKQKTTLKTEDDKEGSTSSQSQASPKKILTRNQMRFQIMDCGDTMAAAVRQSEQNLTTSLEEFFKNANPLLTMKSYYQSPKKLTKTCSHVNYLVSNGLKLKGKSKKNDDPLELVEENNEDVSNSISELCIPIDIDTGVEVDALFEEDTCDEEQKNKHFSTPTVSPSDSPLQNFFDPPSSALEINVDLLGESPTKTVRVLSLSPEPLAIPVIPVNLLTESPVKICNVSTLPRHEMGDENPSATDNNVSTLPRHEMGDENPSDKRVEKSCPLCGANIQNLPRHLRTKKHKNLSHEESLKISHSLRKRRSDTRKDTKHKNYHKRRICAFPGCGIQIENVSHHLRNTHRMERNDHNYLTYLADSRPVEESPQVEQVEEEHVERSFQLNPANKNQDSNESRQATTGLGITTRNQIANAQDDSQIEFAESFTNGKRWTTQLQNNFYQFLCGPDGGRKDKLTAKQAADDVARIVTCINAESDLSRLFDANVVRDEYLANSIKMRMKGPADKDLRAATIRKYLQSLVMFLTYVIIDKVQVINVEAMDILNLKMRVVLWRKSYLGEEKEHILSKNADESDSLITEEQVALYEASDVAKNASYIFEDVKQHTKKRLSQNQYCATRDHLFTRIHFTNACRSGVTANMTVNEFNSGKMLNDGRYMFRVAKHKTRRKYGPANVTLSNRDYNLLKLFIDHIREQLPVQSDTVFLSWSGRDQKSGDISDRLHNLWLKSGVFSDEPNRLTSNKIRKSAATELRRKKDNRLQEAADCMAHSVTTADKHYFVRQMEESSAIGSSAITDVFYKPKTQTTPKKKTKKTWSQGETEQIITHFSPLKDVSMDDVRSSHAKIGNASDKEIYNKIKSLERHKNGKKKKEMKKKEMKKKKTQKRKCLFSSRELEIMQLKCQPMIKGGLAISKANVNFHLDGEDMLRKYSFTQLRTRISYERTMAEDEEDENSFSESEEEEEEEEELELED
ncbi:uncharacterized protein [Clytia hemisphaerica]|uniref:Uncharacterized protein n=1 Tax=Clytia hemisphaerica TaxID=252671 RepID=A0A7M5VD60_9CNID